MEPDAYQGALIGVILSLAGSIAGMALTMWAFDRGHGQFMATLMLGMLGRLVIYGAVLVYLALETTIDPIAMVVAMLGYYVILQVLEIRFVLKRLQADKKA